MEMNLSQIKSDALAQQVILQALVYTAGRSHFSFKDDAKYITQSLREAGLLLEWRTDVENAPVGCIALVSIPDAEIPELAMLDRQYGWCRLPTPDGKHRFVKELALSPQPTHVAFIKPPEQT